MAPVDFLVMAFTFAITLFWNVEKGLTYGIVLSVAILLLQFSRLDMDSIGHLTVVDEQGQQAVRAREIVCMCVYVEWGRTAGMDPIRRYE